MSTMGRDCQLRGRVGEEGADEEEGGEEEQMEAVSIEDRGQAALRSPPTLRLLLGGMSHSCCWCCFSSSTREVSYGKKGMVDSRGWWRAELTSGSVESIMTAA